jgi:hypothetical protein
MDQENRGLRITAWVWMVVALIAFFAGAYQIYASANPQGGKKDDSASVAGASCTVGQTYNQCGSSVCGSGRTTNYRCASRTIPTQCNLDCQALALSNYPTAGSDAYNNFLSSCYTNTCNGALNTTEKFWSYTCGTTCGATTGPTPNNGICEAGETNATHPNDCPAGSGGAPTTGGSTSTCTPAAPQAVNSLSPVSDIIIEMDGGFTLNWKAVKSLGRTCNGVTLRETFAVSAVEKTATMSCATAKAVLYKPVFSGRMASTGFLSNKLASIGYTAQIAKTAGTLTDVGKFLYSAQIDKNAAAASTAFKFAPGKSYCLIIARGNGQSNRIVRTSIAFKS